MSDHNFDKIRQSFNIPKCIRICQSDQLSLQRVAEETSVHDVSFASVGLADTDESVVFGCFSDDLSLLLVHFFEDSIKSDDFAFWKNLFEDFFHDKICLFVAVDSDNDLVEVLIILFFDGVETDFEEFFVLSIADYLKSNFGGSVGFLS